MPNAGVLCCVIPKSIANGVVIGCALGGDEVIVARGERGGRGGGGVLTVQEQQKTGAQSSSSSSDVARYATALDEKKLGNGKHRG